jgi:hypothetical protein
MGGLVYIGFSVLRSYRSRKKYLGIIPIIIAWAIWIVIGLSTYELLHHEDRIREDFVGEYKAIVDENNTEEIEMTITSSTYSISENSYTDCNTGTWSPELLDDGYFVKFSCSKGRSLGQFHLKENELAGFGELRFLRVKANE